jgi:hypothetical protein
MPPVTVDGEGMATASRRPGLWRCLLVGLLAGLAATLLVVPTAGLLQALVDRSYGDELAPAHLAQATVLSSLLGAVAFYAAGRRSARPVRLFAGLAFGFAVGYSAVVAVQSPAPEFARVVAPLHLIVAAVAVGAFAVGGPRVFTSATCSTSGSSR